MDYESDSWNLLEGELLRIFFLQEKVTLQTKSKIDFKKKKNCVVDRYRKKLLNSHLKSLFVSFSRNGKCKSLWELFFHKELLISGIQSVLLQPGNYSNTTEVCFLIFFKRGVLRKLLHLILIRDVFSLEDVTELILHNFKKRWLLWRTRDKAGHSWTYTCQIASKTLSASKAQLLTCI